MTTKLQVYNGALRRLGERELASLSENREPRRVLDAVWADGFVDAVLEQGFWNHAMRTVSLDYEPSIDPPFGLQYAFEKPSDCIRIAAMSTDEMFDTPLIEYNDEGNYIYANSQTIYIRYVSNGASYGGDLSTWPETFGAYAVSLLAATICPRITQSDAKTDLLGKETRKLLIDARSKDAMKESPQFMPKGKWARSRNSGLNSTSRFDINGAL